MIPLHGKRLDHQLGRTYAFAARFGSLSVLGRGADIPDLRPALPG